MGFQLHLQINCREEMIMFGRLLGQAIDKVNGSEPVLIINNGRDSSGKSLIALATDCYFSPKLYPNGITPHATPNETLAHEPGQSPHVVLYNFMDERLAGQNACDQRLANVRDHYKGQEEAMGGCGRLKAIFLQNLILTQDGSDQVVDYTKGMQSDRLDIAINVTKLPGQFVRQIDVCLRDQALLNVLLDALATNRSAEANDNYVGERSNRIRVRIGRLES
jgi:hypothetical protein